MSVGNKLDIRGWLSRGLWAVALAFLSVGGWLSYDEADPVDRPQLASAVASVWAVDETPGSSREAAPVEYLSKPISQLRTMHDRVLAQPFPEHRNTDLVTVSSSALDLTRTTKGPGYGDHCFLS